MAATQRRLSQPSTSAPYRQDFSENQHASFLNSRTLGVCKATASVLFSLIPGGHGRNTEAVVATKYLRAIPPGFSGNYFFERRGQIHHVTFPAERLGATASAFAAALATASASASTAGSAPASASAAALATASASASSASASAAAAAFPTDDSEEPLGVERPRRGSFRRSVPKNLRPRTAVVATNLQTFSQEDGRNSLSDSLEFLSKLLSFLRRCVSLNAGLRPQREGGCRNQVPPHCPAQSYSSGPSNPAAPIMRAS